MENTFSLGTEALEVRLLLPDSEPESERFDSCCRVEQVILHGKHRFCQPEQKNSDRATCWGVGLCSEFDMNDIAVQARAGELFPKPGVGLLRQICDGKPYDMWSHYQIQRFAKTWRHGRNWIEFEETPKVCMGVAARIFKRLTVFHNTLTISTTVVNEGSIPLEFSEYQRNFLALDDLPIGEGYCLELPYDGTIGELPQCFRNVNDYSPADTSCVDVEGQVIHWNRSMDGYAYHKITEAGQILPLPIYRWTLFHESNPARVSEICHFQPWKIVLWGIEHCICPEIYARISAMPGKHCHFSRTWVFEDECTNQIKRC